MSPFRLIEILVFVSAEASIFVDRDAGASRLPLPIAALAVLLFSALRFALPWAKRSRSKTNVFFVVELLVLVAIAVNVAGAALIITSVSVCIRSVELLRPLRDAALSSGVTLALVLAAMTYWAHSGGYAWSVVGGWMIDLLLAWGLLGVLVTFAANERRNNDELRAAQRELIAYASEAAERAALDERARIALDLHDGVGQSLTALSVQLESAMRLRATQPELADALVASAKELGSRVLDDARAIVSRLRLDAAPPGSPNLALAAVCERFERDFGLHVRRELGPVDVPPTATTALVRIAEEALTNVVRHAGTASATVTLGATSGGGGALDITDDGAGFDPGVAVAGQGLVMMRERAHLHALEFRVWSRPSHGTSVAVRWSGAE